MAFPVGEWLYPDSSWRNVPPTVGEIADDEEQWARDVARAREAGTEVEHVPWESRRAAVAAAALVREILDEFGIGVVVELEAEHDPNISPPMVLRGLEAEGNVAVAHFDFADDANLDDPESSAELPCYSLKAVRVIAGPGGEDLGVREPRRPAPGSYDGWMPLPDPD